MTVERDQWDVEILDDLFEQREHDLIMHIPLNVDVVNDVWFWQHENSGSYSVKSCYQWLQVLKGRWSADMELNLWRSLWKTKVPPKVIHFSWKAITGCLPNRTQLYTKHVPVQLDCVCCNSEEESIYHVLVSCNFARSVWNLSSVPASVIVATDFGTWVEQILNRGQAVVFEGALMVSWVIWKARNELLWNKNVTTVAEVINTAKTVLNQWKTTSSNRFSPLSAVINNTSNNSTNWTAPAAGFLKVNVDGAVFAASDCYGLGGLARDANGHLIEAFCLHKAGCVQPSLVEAIGVKEALSWIKKKGWEHVILETDSLVVVQALQNCLFVGSNVPDAINNDVMADLAILS
uniref:RNase H type-1 domain-containing protein n=1 Tax=Cannabis sativa TaxID=3483 RepID=A0A803PB72_CANSA